ncbi:MAG: carboxypeptidase regulatory-like domain-containing protein [Planctomycetes bacterium]|nr:carboxypeptidase regulatory-like domain-containing protein [Planctomycetota bacterium]
MPAAILSGIVKSGATKQPLANASVEIFLPPAPSTGGNTDNGFNPMRQIFGGRDNDGTRLARVRTRKDGTFEVADLRPGTVRIVVQAEDHMETKLDGVVVAAGRKTDRSVVLGVGGTLFGTVTGAKPGSAVRLRSAQGGENHRIDVAKDGSYEAKGLTPGGWFVTVDVGGGGRNNFGRMGASMFRQMVAQAQPDVFVSEGAKQRFDVDATKEVTGKVTGTVRVLGVPTEGYEVSLSPRRTAQPTNNDPNATPADFMARMTSRFLRATSDAKGSFEIENVPPGDWTVQVSRGGGGGRRGGFGGPGGFGGGGGGSIASVDASILAGQTLRQDFDLRIGGIELDLRDGKGKPVSTARVSMALESETTGVALTEWRNLPSFRRVRVDRGIAKVDELAQGRWSVGVEGAGITETIRTVFVGQGQAPVEVIDLVVDEAAMQQAIAEQEQRRAERDARRAAQDAANPGGNNQNGGRRGGNGGARGTGGGGRGARNGGAGSTGGRRGN